MKRKPYLGRLTALLLVLSLLPGLLAACGGEARAAAMRLRRTEGRVAVSDEDGRDVETASDLALYSGYGVETRSESYAWIDLDEVKLAKLDESSEIEITQEDKLLGIEVRSGSLFFQVTEPLAEDETMEIRTSSMVIGIRGTCGWVTVSEGGDTLQLWLLEGKVRCETGDAAQTVRAGESAVLTRDGEITVSAFTQEDIPAFVWVEVEGDEDLLEAAAHNSEETGSGPEQPAEPGETDEPPAAGGDWQSAYTAFLTAAAEANPTLPPSQMKNAYYLYDIDKDGVPELIVNSPSAGQSPYYFWVYTCRGGEPDLILWSDGSESHSVGDRYPSLYTAPGQNGLGVMISSGDCQIWRIEGGCVMVERTDSDGLPENGESLTRSLIGDTSLLLRDLPE